MLLIGHCIQLAQKSVHHVQIIMFVFVFSYVLFQLYSILHAQYLSSTDANVRYIFRDVGSGSQHPDHA